MNSNINFDDIRPYNDDEVPAAMQRIASSEVFPLVAAYVYPDEPLESVRRRIAGYRNTHDFQHETMYRVNEQVISKSITRYSCDGLEQLDSTGSYLYISNHRDIMLDASLLQYSLVKAGFDTTEITFGANLMTHPLVVDIGKCNKMFRVERPGASIREFYRASLHLSEYIRHVIRDKHQSVWIAQRNGRTKDGNDKTDQGIIKMFCMSHSDDKLAAIDDLHLLPVAISYEWEPCDILKTLELYQSQKEKYVKKPGEDLNSILTGLYQHKGEVHIQICEPIHREELLAFSAMTNSEYHKAVAALVDKRILSAYRLYPNNYIAHDLLHGCLDYADRYSGVQRRDFMRHMRELERYDDYNINRLLDIFLGIYANPVDNKKEMEK
ncbi:MAG: acyltransferase [Prevotella sp.]|jgi:hypothetical protein